MELALLHMSLLSYEQNVADHLGKPGAGGVLKKKKWLGKRDCFVLLRKR